MNDRLGVEELAVNESEPATGDVLGLNGELSRRVPGRPAALHPNRQFGLPLRVFSNARAFFFAMFSVVRTARRGRNCAAL